MAISGKCQQATVNAVRDWRVKQTSEHSKHACNLKPFPFSPGEVIRPQSVSADELLPKSLFVVGDDELEAKTLPKIVEASLPAQPRCLSDCVTIFNNPEVTHNTKEATLTKVLCHAGLIPASPRCFWPPDGLHQ